MGLLDRFKRGRDNANEPPSTVDPATGIDFAKYELEQLGNDIRSIIDVPGAIGQSLKYMAAIPIIVGLLTWGVFQDRMNGLLLLPFGLVALMLSFFAAVIIGGFFVARKRLDLVATASNRVVDVIGEMHNDVILVKEGHASTSIQSVAIGLLENAVFPAVFGTLTTAAETSMGPVGRLASSVSKAPMNMVQKSVINAIKSLPDKELGEMVTNAGEALPAASADVQKLVSEYGKARDKMESIVSTVSRTALGSTVALAGIASLPLLIWLVIGWLLS